jgi:hypothetical protein
MSYLKEVSNYTYGTDEACETQRVCTLPSHHRNFEDKIIFQSIDSAAIKTSVAVNPLAFCENASITEICFISLVT